MDHDWLHNLYSVYLQFVRWFIYENNIEVLLEYQSN